MEIERPSRGEAAPDRRGRRDDIAPGLVGAVVIGIPGDVRVYLACGLTDMRKRLCRAGGAGADHLCLDPHGGALFVFRGRRP